MDRINTGSPAQRATSTNQDKGLDDFSTERKETEKKVNALVVVGGFLKTIMQFSLCASLLLLPTPLNEFAITFVLISAAGLSLGCGLENLGKLDFSKIRNCLFQN